MIHRNIDEKLLKNCQVSETGLSRCIRYVFIAGSSELH